MRQGDPKENLMAVLLALLVVALLFGLGFAVKVLWFVALVALALWIIGFFVAREESRWYHW
jgi:type IV secretory pathway TrbD component